MTTTTLDTAELRADIDRMDRRITVVDQRLATVENGLQGLTVYVQAQFALMDRRFDALEAKIDRLIEGLLDDPPTTSTGR